MAEKINLKIDENDLTLGDLEDFEDAVGVSLMDALKQTPIKDPETGEVVRDEKGRAQMQVNVSAKALKGLVWITQRRENPEFSLEDARNVRVAAIELAEADADAEGNGESGDAGESDAQSV